MNNWRNWIIGVILLCLLIVSFRVYYNNKQTYQMLLFDEYIQKHNKSYKNNPELYMKRFGHFLESLNEIDELNAASHDKFKTNYGLTYMSDLSKNEFQDMYLSDERVNKSPEMYNRAWMVNDKQKTKYKYQYLENDDNKVYERRKRAIGLPLEIDWRKKGVIGSVKNQGLCGACWAFSVTGIMESMAAIKTGKLEELSVQEMIDCARGGNIGCSGGDICLLLNWLFLSQTSVERDSVYPLRLIDGTCRHNKNVPGVKIKSFTCNSMTDNEDKLLEMIATHGPVAVAVNALTWQNYLGGVIHYHCSGSLDDLNHAVQLVGYNLNADVPYYIAKNSWGKDFGQDGYLKLAIGSNICGLANEVATVDVIV